MIGSPPASMPKSLGFVCLVVVLAASAVRTQEYQLDPDLEAQVAALEAAVIGDVDLVTLDVDAALWEDDELMSVALASLPNGEVPRGVRKMVAGVIGEMHILLSKRISGDLLTLDDGTTVDARSGKKKAAKKKKANGGATIIWDGDGRGQPEQIVIRSGHCVRFLIFPTGDASGPPTMGAKCAKK